jgi:acyl-CoA reductase-like NAD-dependent aldehyde dehydrogenase
MSNAGQTCTGVERVYVLEPVAEEFIAMVVAKARGLRSGSSGDFGPMTMPAQVEVVRAHVEDALARGGRAVVGGAESVQPPFVEPVVVVDVPEDSRAVTEETFGPVLVINRVADVDEAVRLANASGYGLGASVFSRARGEEIAARLQCGMVAVNGVITFAAIPGLPFGGVGDSGFGRIHGADGLREFTRPQAVARQRFPLPVRVTSFSRPSRLMKALVGVARMRYGR